MTEGLVKAVEKFNEWTGAACIFLDMDTNEVWTHLYPSNNDWTEYYDKSIIVICQKDDYLTATKRVSCKDIERRIDISFRQIQPYINDKSYQERTLIALGQF